MKKFLSSLSPESLMISLRDVIRRFPLSIFLIALHAGYWYYIVVASPTDESLMYIIMTVVTTFFLSVGVYLYLETKNYKGKMLIGLLPLVYGVLFYLSVHLRDTLSLETTTYFLLHLVGFISCVFFAPYLARIVRSDEGHIEYTNYFSRIAWVLLMSAIVGGSLVALGFIAIASVIELFDLGVWLWDSDLYGYWAVTALALVAPLYGLIHIPKWGDIDRDRYDTNRFFAFLIRYIATPASYIYFAILYAYSVKVLINYIDWPKGLISWLVIGFSTFGYLVYIFAKPYEDSRFVSLFRRYFPYAVIPQIAMLAYAIYLRIAQYDLTMNRYFVVIFGIWLIALSLYYAISQRKSLAVIPASLSLIALIISLGPWSVFSYPQIRQESRLMRNLETAKILQSGRIFPLVSERNISKELSTEIAGGIEYLCGFDECARIREIFPDQVKNAEIKAKEEWNSWNKDNTGAIFQGASSWQIQSQILSDLKVQKYAFDDDKRVFNEQEYLYYSVDGNISSYPLDVRGYDLMLQVGESAVGSAIYPRIIHDAERSQIRYERALDSVKVYDLVIPGKLRDSTTFSNLKPEDLTFTVGDDITEIKVIFQNLSVRNPAYKDQKRENLPTPYISGGYGIALVKEKK